MSRRSPSSLVELGVCGIQILDTKARACYNLGMETTEHTVKLSNEKVYRFFVVSTERGLAIRGTYKSDDRKAAKALQGIDNVSERYEAIAQIHRAYVAAGVINNQCVSYER